MADESAFLNPPPGTILGETDYSLPGQISASNNIRYVQGRPQVIGGWASQGTISTAVGTVTNALEWYSDNGTRRLALAGTTAFAVKFGGSLGSEVDITYAGFTSATRWSLALWGETLLAVPTGGTLYSWDLNTANNLTAIGNAPDRITCIGVDDQTRQVLAFGCNEEVSGDFNPRCIRFTDREDNTDWTTSSSNIAGEEILEGSGGQIRTAKKIGTYWAVWTDSELFLGQFTSNPDQPWRFDLVAVGCGCLGLDSVTVANGVAFWFTRDLRLMYWYPGSLPQDVPGLPESYITAEESNLDKTAMGNSFAWYNREFNEVWFHPVSSGQTYPTTYIAVSVPSITTNRPIWFPGTITRSLIYQGIQEIFGFMPSTLVRYQHESGKQGENGTLLSWSFSMLVYIDKGKRNAMVKRLVPDIENQAGNITLTVSKLDWPQGAETTLATKTLAVGQDKSDFRATGRLMRFQFSGNDGTGATDTFARFGSTTAEFVVLGER